MGLIHSRASKQRDRALAAVAREEAKTIRAGHRALETGQRDERNAARSGMAGDSILRQPTLRDAISAARRRSQGS